MSSQLTDPSCMENGTIIITHTHCMIYSKVDLGVYDNVPYLAGALDTEGVGRRRVVHPLSLHHRGGVKFISVAVLHAVVETGIGAIWRDVCSSKTQAGKCSEAFLRNSTATINF